MTETIQKLLARCKVGDRTAEEELFQLYSARLLNLAASKIAKDLQQRMDPDDIMQTVFRTFFRQNQAGKVSIDHESHLWRLLTRLTLNKVRRRARDQRAARRNPSSEVSIDSMASWAFDIVSAEPTPEQAVELTELLESTFASLDPSETVMFQMCLEGFSTTEIAEHVGSTRLSVRRALNGIGEHLKKQIEHQSPKT